MTVYDAQGLVALFFDEPAAAIVEERLRREGEDACVSCVNVAEMVDRLIRVFGQSEQQVSDSLDWLTSGGMLLMTADGDMGRLAGEIRARHYRRNGSDVSLGDCMALSTAISLGDALATSDPALAAAARQEGVDVLALPDSRGRKP